MESSIAFEEHFHLYSYLIVCWFFGYLVMNGHILLKAFCSERVIIQYIKCAVLVHF